MKILKEVKHELAYIILNYFVCYIPIWVIRKLLYRLFGMKIGKGTRILMGTKINYPKHIIIGDNTIINEWCYLDGRGGISIGSNVTIANYTKLITGFHDIDDENFKYCESRIDVGNNVAIFADSVVLAGAIINDGCVFSAKSLIRKGVYNKKGIYAGNPAKFIRSRRSKCEYIQFWPTIFR